MNPTPKIPRGWRKIKEGEIIQQGDKYRQNYYHPHCWKLFSLCVGSAALYDEGSLYIRRVKGRK